MGIRIGRRICTALVRYSRLSYGMAVGQFLGRTGRFGRMGIAINFVHDQKTWQDMRSMEEALGMNISCIETKDFDLMEEVTSY